MIPSFLGTPRQFLFAITSFALGAWAFVKVNQVSGPAFEPILEACQLPIDEFEAKTDYHAYDSRVGFGVFNILVCLITQFILELRQTYPEGVIVWGGVIVASLPFACMATIEAGREGAKGPIRYPIILGLLYQLFGISVMMPLIWVPSYVYGAGYGAVSTTRAYASVPMAIPSTVLTIICFTANTAGSLWTTSAGILGGPGLTFFGALLWGDKVPLTTQSNEKLINGSVAASRAYMATVPIGLIAYGMFVKTVIETYGFSISALWDAIWTNANGPVAFMTIDTIVLWLGVCLYIAYRDSFAGMKALLFSPVMGPGAACSLVLSGLESSTATAAKATKKLD